MHRMRKITFGKHAVRPHLVHVQHLAEVVGFTAFTPWFELFGGAAKSWDAIFAEEAISIDFRNDPLFPNGIPFLIIVTIIPSYTS